MLRKEVTRSWRVFASEGKSGEGGIRTLETVARLRDFQSRSFSHSDTSPWNGGGEFSARAVQFHEAAVANRRDSHRPSITSAPKTHPSVPPATTSDGKCAPSMTRMHATPQARPSATTRSGGYRRDNTAANRNAAAVWLLGI